MNIKTSLAYNIAYNRATLVSPLQLVSLTQTVATMTQVSAPYSMTVADVSAAVVPQKRLMLIDVQKFSSY
jgi:pyridoxine/pyridoxamine 5'-phosphate oxidase